MPPTLTTAVPAEKLASMSRVELAVLHLTEVRAARETAARDHSWQAVAALLRLERQAETEVVAAKRAEGERNPVEDLDDEGLVHQEIIPALRELSRVHLELILDACAALLAPKED